MPCLICRDAERGFDAAMLRCHVIVFHATPPSFAFAGFPADAARASAYQPTIEMPLRRFPPSAAATQPQRRTMMEPSAS